MPFIGFLTSKLGMALIAALIVAGLCAGSFMKGVSVTNDKWEAQISRIKDAVRAEEKARNQKIADALRDLIREQEAAKQVAETEAKELRDAIAADKSDTTLRVSPGLDRVFKRSLEIRGDVHGGPGAPGGTGQPALRP